MICPLDVTLADAIFIPPLFHSLPYTKSKEAVLLHSLFSDDFDEDAFGEFAVDGMDYAIFHEAFEDLALRGGCWREGAGRCAVWR